jgi:mRNA interferase MazF
VIDGLNDIIVAPTTRSVRAIPTEVTLGHEDDMPERCAINLDHVTLAKREQFGELITTLSEDRWPEVEQALLVACGFRRPTRLGSRDRRDVSE